MDNPETPKPELEDFGIKPADYALYRRDYGLAGCYWSFTVGSVVYILLVFSGLLFDGEPEGWNAILRSPLLVFLPVLALKIVREFKRSRLLKTPVASAIEGYEEALAAYEMEERQRLEAKRRAEEAEKARRGAEIARRNKLVDRWMSLGGLEFEREMAAFCKTLGYTVQLTPISGDKGIDLILRKDGKTTIVQCKAHKRAVGPTIVEETLNAMIAFGADNAVLASTGGFTQGAEDFAIDERITLLSARELVRLAEDFDGGTIDTVKRSPICPKPGCSRRMVLRTSYRGDFWGCPNYPRCRGTIDVYEYW